MLQKWMKSNADVTSCLYLKKIIFLVLQYLAGSYNVSEMKMTQPLKWYHPSLQKNKIWVNVHPQPRAVDQTMSPEGAFRSSSEGLDHITGSSSADWLMNICICYQMDHEIGLFRYVLFRCLLELKNTQCSLLKGIVHFRFNSISNWTSWL